MTEGNSKYLSANFTLAELTKSQTATRRGVPNVPDAAQISALTDLCGYILEPLRLIVKRPITINSGFRSPQVNRLVGGSPTSQHMAGEAADIEVKGISNAQLFDIIRASDLPFDQLIDEFGSWIHISYSRHQRRGHCLVARTIGGRTQYKSVGRKAAGSVSVPLPQKSNVAPIAPQETQRPTPALATPQPSVTVAVSNPNIQPVASVQPSSFTRYAWLTRFIPIASLGSAGLSQFYTTYKVYLWCAAIAVMAFWLGWLARAPQLERKAL